MSIEAMKLALAALEWNLPVIEDYGDKEQLNQQHKAITALRQAIEQAGQAQPVAIRTPKQGDRVICIEDESIGTVQWISAAGGPYIKFDDSSYGQWSLREFGTLFRYADSAPLQRQPLTKEFLEQLAEKHVTDCYFDTLTYARAIETAHGIKEEA